MKKYQQRKGEKNMTYNTTDFDELLAEITTEVERIKSDMNIYDFDKAELIAIYNSLTTVLLKLQEI